ncbi:MAG: chloride channel protein [Pedobacter sp.]|nr:chloride channel protein [Pedobacter sp.]
MANGKYNFNWSVLFKWALLLLIVSIAAGTLSAIFLSSLNWVTDLRESHRWLIYLLPLAGLAIGLVYHHSGKNVERGNNLVFDTIHNPKAVIPFKMLPLVLGGTLITHLFGGSAGREGTALQMSASAADQLHKPFKLTSGERSILLIAGLSAGFASVFGTPLAGAIFGIEVLLLRKFPLKAIVPSLIAAYLGAFVTELWGVGHTHYHIAEIPSLSIKGMGFGILAGVLFGLSAVLFVKSTHYISRFSKLISYAPLRPLIGGVLVVLAFLLLNSTKYLGLGVPEILKSFEEPSLPQDFLLKILLTAITLGFGFKGGEVTPLFFIGATLGSALSLILPLPVGLLAGMGFVAVFSAAAKTPVACCFMAIELFGISCGIYVGIACIVAYLVSGRQGIYNFPENQTPRHFLFGSFALFS